MASYDSPGFTDRIPGGTVTESTGAPGSATDFQATDALPDSLQSGTHGYSAVVVPPATSLVNADRVQVGVSDTLVGSEADSYGANRDPLTGIGAELGQTGAGQGSNVMQGHHPNSMSTGS